MGTAGGENRDTCLSSRIFFENINYEKKHTGNKNMKKCKMN